MLRVLHNEIGVTNYSKLPNQATLVFLCTTHEKDDAGFLGNKNHVHQNGGAQMGKTAQVVFYVQRRLGLEHSNDDLFHHLVPWI